MRGGSGTLVMSHRYPRFKIWKFGGLQKRAHSPLLAYLYRHDAELHDSHMKSDLLKCCPQCDIFA